ncbi:hypothetical protein TWF970_000482 [Orbilia oligospora]|uniref:Uncharacterized protein n=1 Tax=Orbilia oligospora TaxID=2813651 RepID=A0A7C8RQH2_ORBOL|nr:hypothetical protein TWF970_000482 [Orbilia oligospora]
MTGGSIVSWQTQTAFVASSFQRLWHTKERRLANLPCRADTYGTVFRPAVFWCLPVSGLHLTDTREEFFKITPLNPRKPLTRGRNGGYFLFFASCFLELSHQGKQATAGSKP